MAVDGSITSAPRVSSPEADSLSILFHRLNNQLGISLAHAELLEARAIDESNRARAGHVIKAVLEAMSIAKDLRSQVSR
jgi:hypothetical protein